MPFSQLLDKTIICLGIILVLIVAFSWVMARLWCKPTRRPISKMPSNYGLEYETIQFYSHGRRLKGWFVPNMKSHSPRPAVILTHGWNSNAAEMLPLAGLLHKAGFTVLLYDSRGHGESDKDGPITIRKIVQDVIAGIAYLEMRPDVIKEQLGVFGRSIGGSAAILAASLDMRLRVVVSCSAFADPYILTTDFLRERHIPIFPFAWLMSRFIERWLKTSINQVAPKNNIHTIQAPILLIHGDTDQFIPPSNMETLYNNTTSKRVERLLVPGRGHHDIIRDASVRQKIVAFFQENLNPVSA